ncbi:MAG: NlpC/P60 family protein [Syntrophomonas sp.]|nr:NlpC/P60 family protein [Syntrophomonas sp.]
MLFFSGTCWAAPSTYTVKSGDCLWNISKNTGVSQDTIMQINNLKSIDLKIGQVLKLVDSAPAPVEKQAPAPIAESSSTYTVISGDTLYEIAQKFGTTDKNIREMNGLSGNIIHPGDVLKVPGSDYTPPVSRAGVTSMGLKLIESAAKHLGTPYQYGGTTPNGFDCSGFVKYVYSKYDINMPRTAAAQYGTGVKVSQSELVDGDLVFFACNGKGIDHVGIYCGNNRFIHSSSPRSGGVIYSALNSGYYASRYVGAKRIIR